MNIQRLPNQICDLYNIDYNDGGNAYELKTALNEVYSLNSYVSPGNCSEQNLINQINMDRPFAMLLIANGSSSGHTVTAKGYNLTTSQVYSIIGDSNYSGMYETKVLGHYGSSYGKWMAYKENGQVVTKLLLNQANVFLP